MPVAANMDGPGIVVAGVGLTLILLLRPWRLPDQASRDSSALVAAILLALLLVRLCVSS